ncbi:MAG TPA: glycosyl hydrolase family 18 protein [Conexibacter sp.]|nr:glycosyl hydrolase family 18 protein [Conexibacter sp.]
MRPLPLLVAAALPLATSVSAAQAAQPATIPPPLAAPLLAPADQPAAASSRVCRAPGKIAFARKSGTTTAVLRWHGPRARMTFVVRRNDRLLGRTTRHALRVPVRLGRNYRFTVIPLGAARCAVTRRVHVAYRSPGAPRRLVASGDGQPLRLSWRPGPRGDGTLAGYRLLRDGATVGQTRRSRWTLRLAPGRTYRFTVVAVDTRGRTSRPSRAVTAGTGHTAPAPPQGVQALAVSDSEIGVQWAPSRSSTGKITGYRVLRDGVVVRQVTGTSHVIGNLAPSADYRISVVAVDSLGSASAPSATVTARTQDPVPTSGHAHAYLLASTDQSFEDFRAHYRQIGVVYPTYFDCRGTPLALVGQDDPLVTRWAQARKVLVLPRINCQGTSKVHQLLTDPTLRERWLDQLTALGTTNGYDGISIDFEAGPASDRTALTSFVATLSGRLHAAGKLLTVAASAKTRDSLTHPRSGIFDYPQLSQSADWVLVMAWGLHWAASAPGAQDDATWVRDVADYIASIPLKHKFVYGTNLYAMDWPAGGGTANPATAYQYGDIVPRFPALGAAVQLDPVADNFHATYSDAGGVGHDVWYPDATTTARRIRLAADRGLGGVGFWRLGLEDQRVWDDPLLAPGTPW